MKRRHIPDSHGSHPNVVPLIDVIMCLIVFFMLVAKIGVSTGAEEMPLPETILGASIEDMGNTITLNIRPGFGDEPRVTTLVDGQSREIRLSENRGGTVVQPLLELLKAFRAINPEAKVIIRGEESMPYHYLERVLMACAEANVKNVNFNTRKVEATSVE